MNLNERLRGWGPLMKGQRLIGLPDRLQDDLRTAAAEIERLRAALTAVVECDDKFELTPYDYLHDTEKVKAAMAQARVALSHQQREQP